MLLKKEDFVERAPSAGDVLYNILHKLLESQAKTGRQQSQRLELAPSRLPPLPSSQCSWVGQSDGGMCNPSTIYSVK